MNERELVRMFDIAYIHCREELGAFEKPRLKIGVVPQRLQTHFHFQPYPYYEVQMQHNTRDDVYPSFLHELVHSYLEYQNQHHGRLFSQLCRKVGGNYSHKR